VSTLAAHLLVSVNDGSVDRTLGRRAQQFREAVGTAAVAALLEQYGKLEHLETHGARVVLLQWVYKHVLRVFLVAANCKRRRRAMIKGILHIMKLKQFIVA